jgi:hypothetical protein
MSLWTGESVMLYPPGAKKATQINERLRLKDKEELTEEIIALRSQNNL